MNTMRRTILVSALSLMLVLASASGVEAAFYVGRGGKGIRVAFRTQGQKLVLADISVRLYCVTADGERHFNHFKRRYASPESPLRLSGSGKFRWDSSGRPQEEGFTEEEFLVGRVGHDFVTGRFEYHRSYNLQHRRVRCQTGTYPFGPSAVPFRARRR